MSLYGETMDELKERSVFKYETFAPFYISSFTTHHFNLMNQKKKIRWVAKDIPNHRLHILFVSPAGYMKTYYLKQMGGTEYAIFRGSGTKIGFEQEMTPPAFTGTSSFDGGAKQEFEGAAKEYENGILLIDEFRGITEALSSQGNGQFESQLLSALDSGRIAKRLARDKIGYVTNLTLWTGVQPAKFDVSSGLGRRLCYLLYMPNRKENDMIIDSMRLSENQKPDISASTRMWNRQKAFIKELEGVERVEICDDVWDYYKKNRIFSFETTFFNTMSLGMTLAKEGASKKVEVSLDDQDIRGMITKEKEWRKRISQGAMFVQIVNIISLAGNSMTMKELYDECTMFGLNIAQVNELITDMIKNGLVMRKGSRVELFK